MNKNVSLALILMLVLTNILPFIPSTHAVSYGPAQILDSYTTAPNSIAIDHVMPSVSSTRAAVGQSFTVSTSASTYKLSSAKFRCGSKTGNPQGIGHAVLYALSGTYGTNSKPTGSALATSDDFAFSSITAGQWFTLTFSGAQQIIVTAGSKYGIAFQADSATTLDGSNSISINYDSVTKTHSGNYFEHESGAWSSTTVDTPFYVYGQPELPVSSGVEDAAVTIAELFGLVLLFEVFATVYTNKFDKKKMFMIIFVTVTLLVLSEIIAGMMY